MVSVILQLTLFSTFNLIILIQLIHVSTSYPVDCSKFVFAPTCRGVIAKRINDGFKSGNSKSLQGDLLDRSDSWPEINPALISSTSYKNLITKLLPSMVKEFNSGVNNNNNLGLSRDWDKLDSVYQGNDAMIMGS